MKLTIPIMALCLLGAPLMHPGKAISQYLEADAAFIKEHSVSDDIAHKLDRYADKLAKLVKEVHASPRQKHGVWRFDSLPGYYVKYNVTRVTKAVALKQAIEEEHLDLLHVPEKRLYHIKGRPTDFSSLNYVVVIKKVKDNPSEYDKPMNLEQVRQIITAIKKSGHISLYEPNHLRLSGGRISFIDTDGGFDKEKTTIGIIRMLDRNLSHYYTPDALAYVIDEIAKGLVSEKIESRKNKWIDDLGGFLQRRGGSMRKKVKTLLSERIRYYEAHGIQGEDDE